MAREADVAANELQAVLTNSPQDTSRCRELAEQIGELRRKKLVRLVDSIAEVRKNLTADQRAQLDKMKY